MPERPVILYVYDALCGWCYGFSPVMMRLYEARKNDLRFDVISGGLMLGERAGPVSTIAPYILQAYKNVENRTGVRFGEAFLNGTLKKGTALFSSEPPAVALSVFKSLLPDRAVEFAHTLQHAINFDGIEPAVPEQYRPYAEQFGLDGDTFVTGMSDPAFLQAARNDFSLSARLGVTGFPAVFLLKDKQLYLLARGYTDPATLDERLDTALTR